jgi:hypothetical protein
MPYTAAALIAMPLSVLTLLGLTEAHTGLKRLAEALRSDREADFTRSLLALNTVRSLTPGDSPERELAESSSSV